MTEEERARIAAIVAQIRQLIEELDDLGLDVIPLDSAIDNLEIDAD
jgi:hypothetical protein